MCVSGDVPIPKKMNRFILTPCAFFPRGTCLVRMLALGLEEGLRRASRLPDNHSERGSRISRSSLHRGVGAHV